MTIRLQRIARLILGGLAAAAFLLAPTALLSAPASQAAPVTQGCYNGVIPWNPYLKSCSLPSTTPHIRGAAPDATAATWSSARRVRDALAQAGFQVQRVPGYAGKREMTVARCRGLALSAGEQAE